MAGFSSYIPEIGVGGTQDKMKWGGLITAVQDPRFLQFGQSYDQNNWLTSRLGDNIQLRRGQALLGKTRRTGTAATGLGVGILNATQVPFFSAARSIYYYDSATGDTKEVDTTDILPTGADGEDLTFMAYQNLAGSFVFATSPHSSIYKIPVANPGSVVDLEVTSYRFAFARIDQGRMWGLGRYGTTFAPDLNSTYISKSDKASFEAYSTPTIDQTVATGDGTTKKFSGTITVAAKNTIFNTLIGGAKAAGTSITAMSVSSALVSITAAGNGYAAGDFVMVLGVTSTGSPVNGNIMTVVTAGDTFTASPTAAVGTLSYGSGGTVYPLELFLDQNDGVLTSNLGGTGTINYATGAVSLTFNTAPINAVAIIANNYTEDSTSSGIADFSYSASNPLLGDGYQFMQAGGGNAMASGGFQGVEYVFHQTRSWVIGLPINTTAAYTDATNSEYWSLIGIPYPRALYPTGDGILYLDNTAPAQPKFSTLAIPPGTMYLTIVPEWISQDLDLSGYTFNKAVVFRWGEYNILACQVSKNGMVQSYNTVFFVQNIYSNNWNKLDYSVSALDIYNGTLLSSDSLSPNLFTLFSGLDDDGSLIPNYWKSAYTDLGFPGAKKSNYLVLEGLIQRNQSIDVYLSFDGGTYVKYGTVSGTATYVNNSSPVGVGSNTPGSTVVGGGEITALPYEVALPIHTDLYEEISVQFIATSIGWAQVNRMALRDNRLKRRRLLSTYEGTQ